MKCRESTKEIGLDLNTETDVVVLVSIFGA
jgi:hypothetical protein